MTPGLLEEGTEARTRHEAAEAAAHGSGGRDASYGRVLAPGALDLTHGSILYLDDITVSFDGFKALNRLSLDIAVGELRCIIGPNGAGKTTLMDVITGKTRPDAGSAFFGSTLDLLHMREAEVANAGIGRKFQKPSVFEALTVRENLELALRADRRARAALHRGLQPAQREQVDAMLTRIHLAPHAARPRLLLLDEPVAGMTDEETARTAELFLSLQGEHSLMVVEHDMAFIEALTRDDPARKVTVLHEGSVLAEGSLAAVQADERVVEVYLGR